MSHLEWAESQLAEIEVMSSMFPSPSEFEITDQLAVAELRDYVAGSATGAPPPSRPHFIIKQKMDISSAKEVDVTLSFRYPCEYPSILPEMAVRCVDLSRAQQVQLQSDLSAFLRGCCRGEVCVLPAVEWVKENGRRYAATGPPGSSAASPPPPEKDPGAVDAFSRLWIYSHHIYNKTKRKSILEWSRELGLSGFSMPGKPGMVCVEGPQAACEEFWSRVKVLTWKKIMIRHREDLPLGGPGAEQQTADSLRKFSGFEEALFDPHGSRGNHMDLGQLFHFLDQRGCCHVFRIFFGIEGR